MTGTFRLHSKARLLTPEAPGMDVLFDALRAGRSLRTRQGDGPSVVLDPSRPQRVYCETSGTSGAPKTIRRDPQSWIASFETNRALFGLTDGDVFAVLGGLGHSLSLYAALEALHIGAGLALLAGRAPRRQSVAIGDLGVTVLYATPSQLGLLAAAGVGGIDSVRLVLAGGGRLVPGLRAALTRIFPVADLREFFGASETSFIALSDDTTPEGAVGRPYPGVTLRIGAGLPPGETGEIWVASPYLSEGYDGGRVLRRDGTYVSIGEIGFLTPSGHLVLRGRSDRRVTVSDRNVYPEEIERIAAGLPDVGAVAALPVPDARRGHAIVCVIEGPERPKIAAELRRRCAAMLGPASVPRRVVFTAEFPLLAAGKPDLRRLADWLGEQA